MLFIDDVKKQIPGEKHQILRAKQNKKWGNFLYIGKQQLSKKRSI